MMALLQLNSRIRRRCLGATARLGAATLVAVASLGMSAARAQTAPQAAASAPAPAAAAPTSPSQTVRQGDFIVAVVNQELVTNSEVQRRMAQIEQDAARNRQNVPPRDELRKLVVDQLIDERAQLSLAREEGIRVDDAELDRAVQSVAAENQLTLDQLRQRLQKDGIDFARFRNNVRDQILLERVRDRDVQERIKVSDRDIDDELARQRKAAGASVEFNIAQLLVEVPDNAAPGVEAAAKQRAEALLARARAGEDFAALVKSSSDGSRENGGQLGMRPSDRLPDVFVAAMRGLKPGDVVPTLIRSGAGFHVLKLVDKREAALTITQTHARHILLRNSPGVTQKTLIDRLAGFRQEIVSGQARFGQLAREYSQDGSADQGGDLGWANPGQFVPEFEQALAALKPGEVSNPVVSRFGVHLIQLIERREVSMDPKQERDAVRNMLREQKYDEAYADWARETRNKAYIEMRDAPT